MSMRSASGLTLLALGDALRPAMRPVTFQEGTVQIAPEQTSTQRGVEALRGPGYVAGWGTVALINAGLAQSKNRSGFGWFVLSLFLGPIATFCLVAFCDRLPEREV